MDTLPTDNIPQSVTRRSCIDCGTKWSGVDAPADAVPERCPECGGASRDAEIVDALDNTAPWAIDAIRRDERQKLAALLDASADTIGGFVSDGPSAVRMVAFMVALDSGKR